MPIIDHTKFFKDLDKRLGELKKLPKSPSTDYETKRLKNVRDFAIVITTLSKDKNRGKLNATITELAKNNASKASSVFSAAAGFAGIDGAVGLASALKKLNDRSLDSFLTTIIDDGSLKEVLKICREETIALIENLDDKSLKDVLKDSDLIAPRIQKLLGLAKKDADSLIESLDSESLKKLFVETLTNEDITKAFTDNPNVTQAQAQLHAAEVSKDARSISEATKNLQQVQREERRTPAAIEAEKKFQTAVTTILTGQNARDVLSQLDSQQFMKVVSNSPQSIKLFREIGLLGAEDSAHDLTPKELEKILLSSSKEAKDLVLNIISSPIITKYLQAKSSGIQLDEAKMKQVTAETISILKSEQFKTLVTNSSEHLLDVCTTSPLIAKKIESFLGLTAEEFKTALKDQPELLKNMMLTLIDQDSQVLTDILTNQPNAKQHLLNVLASDDGRKFIDAIPEKELIAICTKENSVLAKTIQDFTGMSREELASSLNTSPEATKKLLLLC
jgi:hypothetical protein